MQRRTWCRVCRRELRLPLLRALVGLGCTTCKDKDACGARYLALPESRIRGTRPSPVLTDADPRPRP